MYNHVGLMGRLVADPELRRTQNGTAVTSFRIAVDRDYQSKDSTEKNADFIDIVAWKNTADYVSKYFRKGRMAIISGRLQSRNYTDKDGNKRKAVEVVADSVYFGDSKKTTDSAATSQNQFAPAEQKFVELPDDDTDVPF